MTLSGILLIVLGIIILKTDSDFAAFGIAPMAIGTVLLVNGLLPLLSLIK